MTKDVIVSISGLQIDTLEGESADEPIEVITPANYFRRNGKHYILYEEITEGVQGITKNKIKISGNDLIEIRKSGVINAEMVFQKNKQNLTYYRTPHGQLLLGVHTTHMQVEETESDIRVKIRYELDINHKPLAECNISINVQSKQAGTFKMMQSHH
ncbi:MAG: DUF1934 domain-containing protein [Lachnospiraceae bacterium]